MSLPCVIQLLPIMFRTNLRCRFFTHSCMQPYSSSVITRFNICGFSTRDGGAATVVQVNEAKEASKAEPEADVDPKVQFLDFKHDVFRDELLNHPFPITYAMHWAPSAKDGKGKFYTHGIWPVEGHNYWQVDKSLKENKNSEVFYKNEKHILKYWPNLLNPTCIESSMLFISRQWKKHGAPAGMSLPLYVFYGLALRDALPDDLGLRVGESMTIKDASDQVHQVLKNMVLFGENVGADVYPLIQTVIDPKHPRGDKFIKQVRLLVVRELKEGIPKWQLQQERGSLYTGKSNSATNRVILPS